MNKKVTLKSLSLVNFKGIKNLTVPFGEVTEIRGANATGKTTIADAFTWVLFGKDSHGDSDTKFGIKTVGPDGKAYEKLDHEVTAILDVNGEEITVRRCYTEKWVTKRGSSEPVLEGHTTEYFYNGVPLKEGEYKAKISAIIEDQLFKMLTNPLYFAGLDWPVQREMLLRIAGGVTYEEIAANRADFSALLTQLSGKDLAEFKAELSARKKKIQEELEKIPTRVDEITRATPVKPDYEALEAEKTILTTDLDEVDTAMTNKAEAARTHYEKSQATQKEINDLRTKQQDILFKAKENARKEANEKNSAANEAKNKYDSTKREHDNYVASSDREIADLKHSISDNEKAVEDAKKAVENKRNDWYKRNEDTYKESTEGLICPIYKTLCSDASGLQLDSSAKTKAKQAFEIQKTTDLERITTEGSDLNKKVAELQKYGEDLVTKLNDLTLASAAKKSGYLAELLRLENLINETKPAEDTAEIKGEDLPEWTDLEAKINDLSKTIGELPATDNSELTSKKKGLNDQLDEVKRKLSLRSVIDDNNKRKAELLAREKDLAQQKADLEKQEFVADELSKAQMNEVEHRVNQKFQLVRFKMFSQQINGGEKPDCILISMATGAKFNDTNSADKINIGLDIINTLCSFYEVSAPIFIDNAEGVNKLIPVASQLVKLIVTTDKELQIS